MNLETLKQTLPVARVLPGIDQALAHAGRAVLQAPPGAGKTTFIPPALMDAPWLGGQTILMLEPRRLAARSCARFMARLLGEQPGETVGYQIRNERCMGPHTRIQIITEGILTRMLQSDPELPGVGLVIFDEFHERHLESDLGLALCLESAEALREDLRILVMSATMDVAGLSALMDGAPVIESQGKMFPVETFYCPPDPRRTAPGRHGAVLSAAVAAVGRALAEGEGDILVFLPGQYEIRRMEELLAQRTAPGIRITPLYGNLDQKAQMAAIGPAAPGERKVILSTAIAETSLTLPGIRAVVDSGLMRVPRYFPGTAATRLETIPVSRASAHQRRGRAGRIAPGRCYRIWSEHSHQGLLPFSRPEILSADLTGLALELALWGVSSADELKWLDLPPAPALDASRELLKELGALDAHHRITPHGKTLARAGIHPRLAHMCVTGFQLEKAGDGPSGMGRLACVLAAVLTDGNAGGSTDIRHHVTQGKSRGGWTRINQTAQRLEKRLGPRGGRNRDPLPMDRAGFLLALAFPQRVGKPRNRKDFSYTLASGSGAFFREPSPLATAPFIVAAHLDGATGNAGIRLAAPLEEADVMALGEAGSKLGPVTSQGVEWDRTSRSVKARNRVTYGRLVLRESPLGQVDPELAVAAMMDGIREVGVEKLPWSKSQAGLMDRCLFLRASGGMDELPDLSATALGE
ncbi:MAG: ATP-dependent helicase HrpB, partial [Desulfobacterales bacterium]|nr:ATP-dependent helicase HrpB [Desulfobacterales bacterium]